MDFCFMLTRADRTIEDALDVLAEIRPLGLRHIGFKDVGIERAKLVEVHRAIKEQGAISYLEVVSMNTNSMSSLPHATPAITRYRTGC